MAHRFLHSWHQVTVESWRTNSIAVLTPLESQSAYGKHIVFVPTCSRIHQDRLCFPALSMTGRYIYFGIKKKAHYCLRCKLPVQLSLLIKLTLLISIYLSFLSLTLFWPQAGKRDLCIGLFSTLSFFSQVSTLFHYSALAKTKLHFCHSLFWYLEWCWTYQ